MIEKCQYKQPRIVMIDVYGEEMMKDFVPFSETEVVNLPSSDTL